jgi:hypothetical protein
MKVGLEAQSHSIDFSLLPGKWKLIYTTAPDVQPLLAVDTSVIPLHVPSIYQQFSSVEEGLVKNIIEISLPPFVDKGKIFFKFIAACFAQPLCVCVWTMCCSDLL